MHLPGYLDGIRPPLKASPLVDATGWIGDDLFWPAFLLHVGMARCAPEAFDADLADLDVYLDGFEQPDRWPVFAVPVGGGTVHLIVRNLHGDRGIDWVLDARTHAALARLAEKNGAYHAGPGLPWPMLPKQPAHLLMALPAFGDRDVPSGMVGVVARALREVGATTLVDELARQLLEHRACVLLQ